MKKRYLILIGVIIILAAVLLIISRFFPAAEIIVYGHPEGELLLREEADTGEFFTMLAGQNISELLLIGSNGRVVIVPAEVYENFRLCRRRDRWVIGSEETGPVLRGVKYILCRDHSPDFGLYHLEGAENVAYYSTYELLKGVVYLQETAVSVLQGVIPGFSTPLLTISTAADSLLFVYENGEEEWQRVSAAGEVVLRVEQLLPGIAGRSSAHALKAVWENPPVRSALDIYDLLMDSLAEGPAMAIFIDGLGYKLWNHARSEGYTVTFPEIEFEPMRVVYPPRTVYNYYAFGTGRLLTEEETESSEIFTDFEKTGLRGIIFEGEMQLYPSPLEQVLHPRSSRYSDIDGQIFATASELLGDYDFIFIHFHDIDNNGHRYGPYSEQVLETISRTGYYISELAERWKGNLFIFSDHGMHQYYDAENEQFYGTHYTAGAEDIIGVFAYLPARIEGGLNEEKE